MIRPRWETGVAEVTSVKGRHVFVKCPFCGKTHKHGRALLGSRNVAAGCHQGWSRLREYKILDTGAHRNRKPVPA